MIQARCEKCGAYYPGWDEHSCAPARKPSVNEKLAAVAEALTGVNKPKTGVNAKREGDRHAPGYMAGYMRKRRAKTES